MSDIISQLITPQVRFVFILILIFIAALYILSIIWVIRDSYLRGTNSTVWGIVALIPFVGAMAYAMMRPPLYASDREEQNIGLLLQQRELMDYGECPQCGYPTIRDYVLCPNCHTRLRNQCGVCGHTLEQEWSICPYCGTRAEDSLRSTPSRPNVVQRRPEQRHLEHGDAREGAEPAYSSQNRQREQHRRTAAGEAGEAPRRGASAPRLGSQAPSVSGRMPRVGTSRRPSSSSPTVRRPSHADGARPSTRRTATQTRQPAQGRQQPKQQSEDGAGHGPQQQKQQKKAPAAKQGNAPHPRAGGSSSSDDKS
ncbi:MAG: zinc ribbon domain-containing protein [Coriobacteriales bacterium]